MDSTAPGWTRIDNVVIDALPDIGLAPMAVYIVIAKHADAAGVAWPSIPTIARLTATTDRTVQRAIAALQAKRLIQVERRKNANGRPAPNLYTLSPVGDGDTRAPLRCHGSRGDGDKSDRGMVTPEQVEQDPKRTRPKENKSGGCAAAVVLLSAELDFPNVRAAWDRWQTHRRELRKPLTPSTLKSQLAKLAAMGPARAITAIDHSIEKGWTGIFEPSNGKLTNSRTGPGQVYDSTTAHLPVKGPF